MWSSPHKQDQMSAPASMGRAIPGVVLCTGEVCCLDGTAEGAASELPFGSCGAVMTAVLCAGGPRLVTIVTPFSVTLICVGVCTGKW